MLVNITNFKENRLVMLNDFKYELCYECSVSDVIKSSRFLDLSVDLSQLDLIEEEL